jgi:hypothetical protein
MCQSSLDLGEHGLQNFASEKSVLLVSLPYVLQGCDIMLILKPLASVMYILCNEEPLWMSKCLSIGGPLEYKGSWKKTTLCRYVTFQL